jgi:hypothetical protein
MEATDLDDASAVTEIRGAVEQPASLVVGQPTRRRRRFLAM